MDDRFVAQATPQCNFCTESDHRRRVSGTPRNAGCGRSVRLPFRCFPQGFLPSSSEGILRSTRTDARCAPVDPGSRPPGPELHPAEPEPAHSAMNRTHSRSDLDRHPRRSRTGRRLTPQSGDPFAMTWRVAPTGSVGRAARELLAAPTPLDPRVKPKDDDDSWPGG